MHLCLAMMNPGVQWNGSQLQWFTNRPVKRFTVRKKNSWEVKFASRHPPQLERTSVKLFITLRFLFFRRMISFNFPFVLP